MGKKRTVEELENRVKELEGEAKIYLDTINTVVKKTTAIRAGLNAIIEIEREDAQLIKSASEAVEDFENDRAVYFGYAKAIGVIQSLERIENQLPFVFQGAAKAIEQDNEDLTIPDAEEM